MRKKDKRKKNRKTGVWGDRESDKDWKCITPP